MIIYGTYVDGFEENNKLTDFTSLDNILTQILPEKSIIHLLPFLTSTGDSGFAPNSWYEIRPEIGTWEEFKILSKKWRIIVDGIYNHVGISHDWVKKYKNNPEDFKDFFVCFKDVKPEYGPITSRNSYALKKYNQNHYLWHSFNDYAVDINLKNDKILNEIKKNLDFLTRHNIWGIRLDAIAYYGKRLGSQIRHLPEGHKLADTIAAIVKSKNINMIAQLDCDENGLEYFENLEGGNKIPINDFMYPTYLIVAFIEHNPSILVDHIRETKKSNRTIIRIPRTHDGILLRSKLLKPEIKKKVIDFAKLNEIKIRMNTSVPYELNTSAPYIYSLVTSLPTHTVMFFIVAITGMFSGCAYFYLPMLLGFMPEKYVIEDDDPRMLNRLPVKKKYLNHFLNCYSQELKTLLSTIEQIHNNCGKLSFKSVEEVYGSVLILKTIDLKYKLIANFNSNGYNKIDDFLSGNIIFSKSFAEKKLGPLGFVILKNG